MNIFFTLAPIIISCFIGMKSKRHILKQLNKEMLITLNSDLNTLASIIIELMLGTTYEQVEESMCPSLKAITHLWYSDLNFFVSIVKL